MLFLENPNLKLSDVLSTARAFEVTKEQLVAMNRPRQSNCSRQSEVNATHKKIDKSRRSSCYACDKLGHFQQDEQCPTKRKRCMPCGKIGHFKAQCRSNSGNFFQTKNDYNSSQPNVNCLEDDGLSVDRLSRLTAHPDVDIFTVESPVRGIYRMSLDIGSVRVPNVVIDSGAVTIVIAKIT